MTCILLRLRSLAILCACVGLMSLSGCQDRRLSQAVAPSDIETAPRDSVVARPSDRVSSIFQEDPSAATEADAAVAWAIANLPEDSLSADTVAQAANALLRVPNAVVSDKLIETRLRPECSNYSKFGETVDLRDIAFVLAGTGAPDITPQRLLDNAVNLLPGGNSLLRDIAFIPGQTNPCQFNIQLRFIGNDLNASQQALVRQAADRWTSAIVSDLPEESFRPSEFNLNQCVPNVPDDELQVDDIFIDVSVAEIDGEGEIKAIAGPCLFRSGSSSLPIYGFIEFDAADLLQIDRNGRFENIALHEIAHVLGFATLWSEAGLIGSQSENGTTVPVFTGEHAVRAYAELGGSGGVPLEIDAPEDANGSHWRQSVFGNELMTFEGQVGFVPLSRVTIAQFADLGYEVNLDAADPYELPNPPR